MPPPVSVIIVSLNGAGRLHLPLAALAACDPAPEEVIVVDNGSTDGTAREARRLCPRARVVRSPRNLGFAGGNNLGIVNAGGEILILLNDDAAPRGDFLRPLLDEFAARPRLGIAGARLLYPGGATVQHLGAYVEANGLTKHVAYGEADDGGTGARGSVPSEYVTGAAFAIRRAVVADIGLLDPGFFPIYYEEVDYCERARRAGWEVRVVPACVVIHHESQTTGRFSEGFLRSYHRNRWRFLLRNRRGWAMVRAIRAEAHWLAGHTPRDQRAACARAYADAAIMAGRMILGDRGA